MNMTNSSPPPATPPGDLIFRLEVPGRLPSWNTILGMQQWARYKYKQEVARGFLFALQHAAQGSSTRTICARSSLSTFCDTLASYLTMRQEQRKSRLRKKRRAKAKKKL